MKKILKKMLGNAKHVKTMIVDYDLFPVNPMVDDELVYLTVNTQEAAIKLYDKFDNIVVAPKVTTLYDTPRRFGMVLVEEAKNLHELTWSLIQLSPYQGVAIYRYDHLTTGVDASDSFSKLKEMVTKHARKGIQPVMNVQEDGKKYIIATRRDSGILSDAQKTYNYYASVFTCPILDVDHIEAGAISNRPGPGLIPPSWVEREPLAWRWDYHKSKTTLRSQLLEKLKRQKLLGSSVMPLNREQMAIALASGRFKKEIKLSDGRVFIFKGTEVIKEQEVLKKGLDGHAEAVRVIEKKIGTVVGLEMIRGEYVNFQ